jgi:hypothetical protein
MGCIKIQIQFWGCVQIASGPNTVSGFCVLRLRYFTANMPIGICNKILPCICRSHWAFYLYWAFIIG